MSSDNNEMAHLTADLVVLCPADVLDDHASGPGLHYLAVKRLHDPFAGEWALPGGHLDKGEDDRDAAVRECREETNLDVPVSLARFVGAYRAPYRDPRGRYVTFAWVVLLPVPPGPIKAQDDAKEVAWLPVTNAPGAFDHTMILNQAIHVAYQ